MGNVSLWAPIISSVSGLAGVGLGAWITYRRDEREKKRRHLSYWSALLAEVDLCKGLAEAYVRDGVKAPLYRLPSIAYDKGFEALLGDGAVSGDEARAILRFYSEVIAINRGLEYAHAATETGATDGALDKQASRLMKKTFTLYDPDCKDKGGPYYDRVISLIRKHVDAAKRR